LVGLCPYTPGSPILGAGVADPGDCLQQPDGFPKGLEGCPDLLVDCLDGSFNALDLPEVQLKQEAVILRDTASQRFHECVTARLDLRAGKGDQLLRVSLARDHGAQHRPAAHPHDVAEHTVELDVHVLERLLDALDVARLILPHFRGHPHSTRRQG
jgi:hypothetical protein